jgi:hypothetical protein
MFYVKVEDIFLYLSEQNIVRKSFKVSSNMFLRGHDKVFHARNCSSAVKIKHKRQYLQVPSRSFIYELLYSHGGLFNLLLLALVKLVKIVLSS